MKMIKGTPRYLISYHRQDPKTWIWWLSHQRISDRRSLWKIVGLLLLKGVKDLQVWDKRYSAWHIRNGREVRIFEGLKRSTERREPNHDHQR